MIKWVSDSLIMLCCPSITLIRYSGKQTFAGRKREGQQFYLSRDVNEGARGLPKNLKLAL